MRNASFRLIGVALAVVGITAGLDAQTAAPAKKSPTPAKAPATLTMPPAVEAAFKKAYPDATIKNVAKEKENGVEQYELESADKGLARDLMYLADGSVISMEEEMSAADFPSAVAAAIKARYPKATITRREKLIITKGHLVHYEAALAGVAVTEAILTVDGSWVSPKAPVKGK